MRCQSQERGAIPSQWLDKAFFSFAYLLSCHRLKVQFVVDSRSKTHSNNSYSVWYICWSSDIWHLLYIHTEGETLFCERDPGLFGILSRLVTCCYSSSSAARRRHSSRVFSTWTRREKKIISSSLHRGGKLNIFLKEKKKKSRRRRRKEFQSNKQWYGSCLTPDSDPLCAITPRSRVLIKRRFKVSCPDRPRMLAPTTSRTGMPCSTGYTIPFRYQRRIFFFFFDDCRWSGGKKRCCNNRKDKRDCLRALWLFGHKKYERTFYTAWLGAQQKVGDVLRYIRNQKGKKKSKSSSDVFGME